MSTSLSEAEQKLATSSRRAALVSLVGFLIVLGAIGYSFVEIDRLNDRKATLEGENLKLELHKGELVAEVEQRQAQVENLRAEAGKLEKENYAKQATIERVGIQLATDNVDSAKLTIAAQPTGGDALAVVGKRRVFMQLRSNTQLDLYEQCAKGLKAAGFDVPKPEILADKGPKANEIRYFRRTEKEDAERIAVAMRKWIASDPRVVYVPGYEDSKLVKPGQFEVWLAK